MVTRIKVNRKNIEFQLAGGGFGAFGDTVGTPSVSTYVPKSEREKRLEKEIKDEKDSRRKRRLEGELADLRQMREREQALLEAQAAQAKILAEARERELRATSGSRFNLWFEPSVPPEVLTPDALKVVLSSYVDFAVDDPRSNQPTSGRRSTDRPAGFLAPSKGLSEQEVNDAYGEPKSRKVERLRDLTVVTACYDLEDGELLVTYVEGVLVRYSMASKR